MAIFQNSFLCFVVSGNSHQILPCCQKLFLCMYDCESLCLQLIFWMCFFSCKFHSIFIINWGHLDPIFVTQIFSQCPSFMSQVIFWNSSFRPLFSFMTVLSGTGEEEESSSSLSKDSLHVDIYYSMKSLWTSLGHQLRGHSPLSEPILISPNCP